MLQGSLQFEGVAAGSDGYSSGFGLVAQPYTTLTELTGARRERGRLACPSLGHGGERVSLAPEHVAVRAFCDCLVPGTHRGLAAHRGRDPLEPAKAGRWVLSSPVEPPAA